MSKYFDFLEAASQDKFLQTIREEVTPLRNEPDSVESEDEVEVEESEDDVFAGIDEEPDEDPNLELKTEAPKVPKAFKKRNSKSLVDLIHKFEPKLDCASDTACLQLYTMNNVDLLQKTYGQNVKNLKVFEQQLQKLRKIISHLYPSTSTQRGAFVTFTGIFKKYYYNPPFNEVPNNEAKGPHLWLIRGVLHADKSIVVEYLKQKEERLTQRLRDKFLISYDDMSAKILKMYNIGMSSSVKKDSILILLAVMGAIGCRKTEVLDPSILFWTFEEHQDNLRKRGIAPATMNIGVWENRSTPDKEHSFEIKNVEDYKRLFNGFAYTVVQFGVLKDRGQALNSYLLDKSDKRFMENKLLVKPSLILTAEQVIDGIDRFREINGITKESFRNRRASGNRFSTRAIKPYMEQYFPQAAAKSALNMWEFGSHFMRKLYSNAVHSVYANSIQLLTGLFIDKAVLASNLLGHGGSIATSLSYANVEIRFGYDPKVFEIPPEELLRNMYNIIQELKRQNEEFQKEITAQVRTIALERPSDENVTVFTNQEGKEVELPRRKKQTNLTDDQVDTAIRAAIKKLKDGNVSVSSNHIKALGFGRLTVQNFTKRHPSEMTETSQKRKSPVPPTVESPADALDEKHVDEPPAKKSKAVIHLGTHPLPFGTKVIAPQGGKPASVKEALRRDIVKFGDGNVLEKPEDCSGTIEKGVLLGKKLTRDLCRE